MNTKKWLAIGGIVAIALVAATIMVPLAFANGPLINRGFQQYMLEDNTGDGFQLDSAGQWGRMRNGSGRFGNGMDTFQAAGPRGRGQGQGFVDANGDGLCDNCGTTGRGPGFVDADGDGVCDHLADGERGGEFVDQDGNGICDHAQQQNNQQQHGPRHGNSQGQGRMGRWSGAQQSQLTQ